MIPISQGREDEKNMETMAQTLGDTNAETLYCKHVGSFCGVREIEVLQEYFWVVLLKLVVTAGMLWLVGIVHH